MNEPEKPPGDHKERTSLLGTLQTILGALFGIQSDKKREEDFARADPGKLIALGIITVIVIMVIMIVVVKSVLQSAGH